MHPSFDLKNLQKLPTQLKIQAVAAAGGSLNDISSLWFALQDTAARSLPLLIPAFYANLDPKPLEDLEAYGLTSLDQRISCVSVSVDSLSFLVERGVVPLAAHDELWERGWRWAEFLHSEFRTRGTEGQLFYAHFIPFFSAMLLVSRNSSRKQPVHASSPGFFQFIGSAWRYMLHLNHPALRLVATIVTFASGMSDRTKRVDDGSLLEVIDGVGGTWDAYAELLAETILHAVADQHNPALPQLVGVIFLLHDAYRHRPELRISLLNHGIVTALVLAYRSMMKSEHTRPTLVPATMVGNPLYEIASLIDMFLGLPRRQERVTEALRAGLLLAYFDCPEDVYADKAMSYHMAFILDHRIRSSTMFHSVIAQLKIAMKEVRHLDPRKQFRRAPIDIVSHWTHLSNTLKQRLETLDAYEAGGLQRNLRACDSLQCGIISDKKLLRRCSRCLTAYYCSKECQKTDYNGGMHREQCRSLRERRRELSEDFSPKDRAFFKALMHHEYLRKQDDVSLNFMSRIHDEPSCIPFTTFTFDGAGCTIVTTSHRYYYKVTAGLAAEIRRFGRRDERAGGVRDWRVDMHVMGFPSREARPFPEPQTDGSRYILIPMRSTNAELHDKLCSMAKTIPPAPAGERGVLDPYREEVQELVQSHAEDRRIH